MKLIHLAAVMVMATPIAASANGKVIGAGTITCAKFTKFRGVLDKPELLMVSSWMQGFLTVQYLQKDMRNVDQEQILAFSRKYCAEHPLDMIYQAAQALGHELETQR